MVVSIGNYRRLGVLIAPVQRTIQLSRLHEILYMGNAGIPPQCKVSEAQPCRAICLIQFLGTFTGSPLGAESRQYAADLVAIDAVTAFVRATIRSIVDTAARDSFSDNICQIADTVVLIRLADIEDLIMYDVLRRFEHAQNGRSDIADVDDGTPRCTVALDIHSAGRICPGHQIV